MCVNKIQLIQKESRVLLLQGIAMEEENLSIVHILWLFVLHRGSKSWVSYHPKYGKSLSYQLPSTHVFHMYSHRGDTHCFLCL